MAESYNFKGFRQSTIGEYNEALSAGTAKGYLWLVREYEDEEKKVVKHSQIYFGSRLYAEVNTDTEENEKIKNIIDSLGTMVNSDGSFNGWTFDHEILGGLSSTTEALEELEAAILNEIEARESAISAETTAREEKDAELEERIDNLEKEITSAHTKDIEELKEQIQILSGGLEDEIETRIEEDEKLSSAITVNATNIEQLGKEIDDLKNLGPLHFEGVATGINEDNTIIYTKEGKEVPAEGNKGAVYILGTKEYASDGETWIELGDDSSIHVVSGDDVED